jgi:hypothetical protein
MSLDPAALPKDPDHLRAQLIALMAANDALRKERDHLEAAYREAEAERHRRFRLEEERGIVQPQLLERLAQFGVPRCVLESLAMHQRSRACV